MESAARTHGEIFLSGSLSVCRARQIKDLLLTAIGQNRLTVVRVDVDAEVDAAFLQLLCSAHRTAVAAGKCLSLAIGRSAACERHLQWAGFVRHSGCLLDCNNNCIWVMAKNPCSNI